MSWASSRQSKYFLGVVAFIALIGFIMIYPSLTTPPTCSDGKQNGGEVGVDCGGSCSRLCSSQVSEPIILWSRPFLVVGTTYNLVALVQNQNQNAAVQGVNYKFKAYDANNKIIGTREGGTFIPPNQEFAIFEPRFDAGGVPIKSVSFEFTSPFVWIKKNPVVQSLPITVNKVVFDESGSLPVLTAQVNNDSIYDLPAFDIITILYDADHNAINASKTHNEGLPSNSQAPLTFTWPTVFKDTVITKDVFVQINPFTTPF